MRIEVAGGHINAVSEGEGPLVLLVHGFPEGAWAWRHQLPALAAAGYRAVAIDVRGYGESFVPEAVEAYRMLAHVADNVAVVRALGAETAVVVGHDWGAPIAAASAQVRPDVFTALGMLSVPYTPRGQAPPQFPEDFYVGHFQTPGVAEAEIEADVRGWLRRIYAALTEGTPGWFGVPMNLPDVPLPGWVEDFDTIVAAFERNGFAGPLNRVPQLRARLGGPRRLRPPAPAGGVHHRRARQHPALARRGDRQPGALAPRFHRRPHPSRLRALGPQRAA